MNGWLAGGLEEPSLERLAAASDNLLDLEKGKH